MHVLCSGTSVMICRPLGSVVQCISWNVEVKLGVLESWSPGVQESSLQESWAGQLPLCSPQ